jgi:hypothetical protein
MVLPKLLLQLNNACILFSATKNGWTPEPTLLLPLFNITTITTACLLLA